MKIREINNLSYACYFGANIDTDKVIIYDNLGVSFYKDDKLIIFIEMDVTDVLEFNSDSDSISHQFYINGKTKSTPIYLYKNSIKTNFKVNDLVSKKGDEFRYLHYLYLNNNNLKEKLSSIQIDELKSKYTWKIVEIIDSFIVKIENEGIIETILISDLLLLE